MRAVETDLPEVVVLEPDVLGDERGYFMESWNARTFARLIAGDVVFVQDNSSRSAGGVLRGIHFQNPNPQAKLVRCVAGAIFDVAVDLRKSSVRFGRWVGVELSAANHRQLWIPQGFGHGFLVLGDLADIEYKVAGYYSQPDDREVAWNDPTIGVEWPLQGPPILSDKDANAPWLAEADTFA